MSEIRIAMWSGPRNISTALMRSFGSRPDTFVCDEPLYAHYLKVTGKQHPGFEEVIRTHETDWRQVVAQLTGPIPGGRTVFYQKQMAHHLLPEVDRGWLEQVENAFLIRDPEEMLTSLVHQIPHPSLEDTGLPQQLEIFRMIRDRTGRTPVVLDTKDVLENPQSMLAAVCDRLGLEFTETMLRWPPGPRETDGIWARHWYGAVERSTGFQPYKPKPERVAGATVEVLRSCAPCYEELYNSRLTVDDGRVNPGTSTDTQAKREY